MKSKNVLRISSFVLCGLISITARAQSEKTAYFRDRYSLQDEPRVYIDAGLSPLNSFAFSTKAKYVSDLMLQGNGSLNIDYWNYGIAFELRYLQRIAKRMPGDYTPGDNLISNKDSYPMDRTTESNIYFKRNFYTASSKVHFTAQVGLSLPVIVRSTNFQPQATSSGGWGFFNFKDDNYTYTQDKIRTVGLALKAGTAFPLAKGFGFGTYLSSSINPYYSYAGLDLNIMFGYVRKK